VFSLDDLSHTDKKIYKSVLYLLKNGLGLSISSIARKAELDRKTIRNRIEKHTFQDLEKYKLSS